MKKKKWIGIGIVLVLVFVVIAAVINVNKRFPQRTKEVYAPGEWMPLDNSVSVCADTARILEGEELEACMRDEFGGQDFQVKKKKGRVRQLVIKFRIKNTGDSEINIWQYMLKLAVNSYPDGWTNGLGTHYAPGEYACRQEKNVNVWRPIQSDWEWSVTVNIRGL